MLKREKTFRAITFELIGLALVLGSVLLMTMPVNAQSQDDIKVYVSIMAPKIVSDTFGKRVAQSFIAVQVTIANHNKDYQYLINDVTLDLSHVDPALPPYISSAELSLLRGVAEKGQAQDKRNLILRLFRGVGTIAAGVIGVTSFGPSYPKAVAVFNGPVISAFSEAFPDFTINQMNRLNDSAYQANTLIPARHSKVMVAFLPQAIFLNKDQREKFWNEPTQLFNAGLDFRKAQAYIDGDHITSIANIPPIISGVVFNVDEVQKSENAKPVIKGYIVGRFLSGTNLDLEPVPDGLSIEKDGDPTADRYNFILKSNKPIPPGTSLNFVVSNAQGKSAYSKSLSYQPDPPTLTGTIPTPATGRQNTSVTLTLIGTNFIPGPGKTRVNIEGSDVVVSQPVDVVGTSLKVNISIGKNAATGPRNLAVANDNSESAPLIFTVTTASP